MGPWRWPRTFRVHRKAVTESTNLDARAGSHGDVYVAAEQTAGRGRLDHRWLSAPGENLTLSAVLDVSGLDAAVVATLPLVVGLAVASALERLAPGLDFRVKWPNDVLVDWRKICGVLCERHGNLVVAGVGVNVRQREFPDEIAARATSLALLGGDATTAEVERVLLEELGRAYERWLEGGFGALLPEFARRDALKGVRVKVRQRDDDIGVEGTCGGVAADGALIVDDQPVYAGEIGPLNLEPARIV